MAEEKKHVAMVRCEFDEEGFVTVSTGIECESVQLFAFVSKVLYVCAKLIGISPDDVAKMALITGELNDHFYDKEDRADESENGEES